jgi:hypothetical protein
MPAATSGASVVAVHLHHVVARFDEQQRARRALGVDLPAVQRVDLEADGGVGPVESLRLHLAPGLVDQLADRGVEALVVRRGRAGHRLEQDHSLRALVQVDDVRDRGSVGAEHG